ncbi:MAG: lipopolysaccharide assembly protein LapB [Pseudomonadota bacterium]
MDPVWLLLLLPLAAASGWYMAALDGRSNESQKNVPKAYFKGLSFLLNEQPDKALQVFMEAVEVDEETIEMHMALGNLYRRRGEVERATRIHQNLVARSDLDESLRLLALFELAQDYLKAGLYDRAEGLFQELRQTDEYREQACRFLLQIYDQEKEWQSAIAVAESLDRHSQHDLSESLAQYSCELAEQSIIEGRYREAEEYLASAFKYDARCIRAVIQSGRMASLKGNHTNAIAIWRGLEHWAPEALPEVIDHLSNSFEAIGDVKGYRKFLESNLERCPDPKLITALVELTGSEKGTEARQAKLVELVRKYPSLEGLVQLLKNRGLTDAVDRNHSDSRDFNTLANLLAEAVGQGRDYLCRKCGFNSNSLHWQCPGCKAWGSVQKNARVRTQHDNPTRSSI